MYLIQSNDNFILNQVYGILKQKSFNFTTDDKSFHFARIFFENKYNNKLILSINKSKCSLDYPINIKLFTKKIFDLIQEVSYKYKDIIYFPERSYFIYENLRVDFTETQNLIFSHCILNTENGIVKLELYKKIWPKDKNIFVNKLDTHLTNLKKKIESEVNLSLGLLTKDGKIFLIVN